MKTATLSILALALSAGLAAAQGDASQQSAGGTVQTYNTGAMGESVGKDQPAAVSGAGQPAAAAAAEQRRSEERAARGTGVATGFVAAGVGLAILGLFVRRRGRHDDLDDVGRDDDDYYGGSGTQTRM